MININLQIIEECKSTNASLIKLAKEGYPEGYSLLSINQTCGRGTRKKKWISISGNLFLSTLIRPNVEITKLSQISIIFGLSLFQFIKSLGLNKKQIKIKWPNDILIESKKVSGILVERFENFCVIGVGLNINSHPCENNTGIKSTCLSNYIDTSDFKLSMLSTQLLELFYKNYNIWLSNFLNPFLSQINSNLAFLNNKVDFKHGKIIKSGKIIGINSDGNLKILLNNNNHLYLTSSEAILNTGVICS